jgi:hypothetical protein
MRSLVRPLPTPPLRSLSELEDLAIHNGPRPALCMRSYAQASVGYPVDKITTVFFCRI